MKNFLFVTIVLMLFSCGSNPGDGKTAATPTDSTASLYEPKFNVQDVDSLELYFYKDPAKQNEFTRLFVKDTPSLNALVGNLNAQPAIMNECPHDGKIFLYRGGEVFKTVYVSSADKCNYFAYAINSNQYFVPINDSAYKLIRNFKSLAQ